MNVDRQVDVIVRFHDVHRLAELERCVFSLVGQNHRPLHIILVLQRFSDDDVQATRSALAPLLQIENAPELSIENWQEPQPVDARSVLLNVGLGLARGRYVAFLDYDDVVYPEAYELMTARLRESDAAIAFAAVRAMILEPYDQFLLTLREHVPPFSGSNLLDLFRSNFCPVHSYLIDRLQVPSDILFFDSQLSIEEDYDLLLRICARFRADFSLIKMQIGDYYYKTDGSNTVAVAGGTSNSRMTYHEQVVIPAIEMRRQTTKVATTVLESLGLRDKSDQMTIRELLQVLDSSSVRNSC